MRYATWLGMCLLVGCHVDTEPQLLEAPANIEQSDVPTRLGFGAPLVMLVLDTSGSMERVPNCACAGSDCANCLPNCGEAERNTWITIAETLAGSYKRYGCRRLQRDDEEVFSYDLGYYLPHTRPISGSRDDDGILAEYSTRARFGAASFDSWDTYVGAPPLVRVDDWDTDASDGQDGLWSFGLEADFRFPNTPDHRINTGIRSDTADQGALRVATDVNSADAVREAIEEDLFAVRPYGGTPIAAALDDLYDLFDEDFDDEATAQDRHVVLITDGVPDDDYRAFRCNCRFDENPDESAYCGGGDNDPESMRCPYPLPVDAARYLVEGRASKGDSADRESGTPRVASVHVIGIGSSRVEDYEQMLDVWHAIADAGGTRWARLARDGKALRRALRGVLDEIVTGEPDPDYDNNSPPPLP